MLNLPPVAAATRLQISSAPPYRVSRLFGQLAAMRQLRVVCACTIAGATTLPTARPAAAFFRNDLRFMYSILPVDSIGGPAAAMVRTTILALNVASGTA